MRLRRLYEIRKRRLYGVERAENVNVDDGLEPVGRELVHGREEVTGCTCTIGSLV